jgi:hypothetical protein
MSNSEAWEIKDNERSIKVSDQNTLLIALKVYHCVYGDDFNKFVRVKSGKDIDFHIPDLSLMKKVLQSTSISIIN